MYYSVIGLLAAIILLIENRDILFHSSKAFDKPAWKVFRRFLIAVFIYYVTDILWGILENNKLANLLFADTSVYFVVMAAGIELWTQYLVTYLAEDQTKRDTFERVLLVAGRTLAGFVTVATIINIFYPVLFSVDESCVYHALGLRNLVLNAQIIMLLLVSAYAFSSLLRLRDNVDERRKYRTLTFFGLIVGACLIFQLFYPYLPLYSVGYMLGICLLRAFVIGDEIETYRLELEEATKVSIYQSIINALADDYFNLFYVDLDTDEFTEYGFRTEDGHQTVESHGTDFFTTTQKNARHLLYEEDRDQFIEAIDKPALLSKLDKNGTFIYQYRLLIDGVPTYMNIKATRPAGDRHHLIIGVNNIDAQVKERVAARRAMEEQKSYLRLSALNSNLIVLYYVDPENGRYTEYSSSEMFDELGIAKQGDDFFETTYDNSFWAIHPEDQELFRSLVTCDNVMQTIERDGMFALDYRFVGGGIPIYVTLKAAKIDEDGKPLLIIGLLDEDAQVKREQKYAHDLSVAEWKASVDQLTGVKNKHAYAQWEEQINAAIASGEQEPFAVVVCDINNLKKVNDLYGHKEGDVCIKRACQHICDTFAHSPVFRVGGDEFVVILTNDDYQRRQELMKTINELPGDDYDVRVGGNVSAGMVEYRKGQHSSLLAVFEDADRAMYEQKKLMKRATS